MREIKFRAWSFIDNIMYEICRLTYNLQTDTNLDISKCIFVKLIGKPNIEYNIIANPPEVILMQFTGLKDKNGKEIYEGDVLKFYNGRIGKITWDNEWCVNKYVLEDNSFGYLPEFQFYKPYEVIGNIYENPELLKE